MKYMLLIYGAENAWTQQEWQDCVAESTELCHDLAAKGQFLGASPLHPVSTAVTIRNGEGQQAGQKLVLDGPFAETHEQLGGYFLVDVPDLDAALAIAKRLPGGRKGTVEIRPVVELNNLPRME